MTYVEQWKTRKLAGATNPHIRSGDTVEKIMYLVILALLFPTAGAVYYFGMYVVMIVVVAVLTAIVAEYFAKLLRKRPFVMDGSAIITGLLLALVLPPRTPLWAVAIGSAVAILIAKEAFGGLGHNIFNPALVGRAFLTVSFSSIMTQWMAPVTHHPDGVTSATPLGEGSYAYHGTEYMDLFTGNVAGSIGETSVLLILIGGALLLAFKVINWRIPLIYVGTVAVFMGLLGEDPLFHVLAGGLMFGAFFMATDYVTSPLTNKGKIIFSVGAGILVVAIRLWGSLPEGVAFSILIMNGFVPLIDRYTVMTPYGFVKPEKEEKNEDEDKKEGGK